jgi:hypothetical protein
MKTKIYIRRRKKKEEIIILNHRKMSIAQVLKYIISHR